LHENGSVTLEKNGRLLPNTFNLSTMSNCKTALILIAILSHSFQYSFGQLKNLNGEKLSSIEVDKFIKHQVDSLQMPGLSIVIINNGKIAYHNAFGVANIDSKEVVNEKSVFEAASLSKPAFAYFALKMVDKGILNLDTPLYRYMPYPDIERDERYKSITARMVLSHQSGFPNWRNNQEPSDSILHIRKGDLYLKFTPGTNFSYSGEGYFYLAKVIAHLNNRTLKNLDTLFQQEVAIPLKMQHAAFTGNSYIFHHKVTGHREGKVSPSKVDTIFFNLKASFNPAASLHTDATSYAHFIIGLINGKGLTQKSTDEMFKPQVNLEGTGKMDPSGGIVAWGLGIAIRKTPWGLMYEHGGNNGNFQAMCIFSKENKNGYLFFTNGDKGNAFDKVFMKFLSGGKL
jgi:CubicO group peptidase (beta-lactamase class C family)